MCVCACKTAIKLKSDELMGRKRGQIASLWSGTRELRVLGLSNWGRPGSRGQLWDNPMLCVYVKLQSSSDGEEREDEKVCAVHIYVKAICVDVGSGIGPSHCAVCVVGHVCIVCVVCVCVTIGNTCSTSLVAGHGDMELREPCLLSGCDKRSSEVHPIHLLLTALLHGPCSSPCLGHPPTQGSDTLDLAVVFPTQ